MKLIRKVCNPEVSSSSPDIFINFYPLKLTQGVVGLEAEEISTLYCQLRSYFFVLVGLGTKNILCLATLLEYNQVVRLKNLEWTF